MAEALRTHRICLLIVLLLLSCASLATPGAAQDQPPLSAADLTRLVLHDPASPTFGDPNGDVTIVAFLDYNCPYCRRSTPQLEAFLRSDSRVRVVYKDWPILSAASVTEAKVALAAAFQGRYLEAHNALMAIQVRPATGEAIKAAVQTAGIDVDRLNRDLSAHDEAITKLLARDNAEAEALGFSGTPVFLVGPFKFEQELDEAGFRQAVVDARARLTTGAGGAGPAAPGPTETGKQRIEP